MDRRRRKERGRCRESEKLELRPRGPPVGQHLIHALQQRRFKDRKVDKDLVSPRAYNSVSRRNLYGVNLAQPIRYV